MPDKPETRDEQLEEMVAYLDGELSAEASLRVEERLAADAAYRQRLQRLERAWHALDELPLATVDDKFSRTTMTLVVRTAAEEVQEKTVALPVVRRRRRWSSALAAVAAAALGFLVLRLVWQNPNAPLMADLPVIDNVDLYSQIGEVAFLTQLHDQLPSELNDVAADSAELTRRLNRFQTVSDSTGRDQWLRQLSDDDQTNLRAKFNRFRNLSPDQQRRLRELHDAVVAAPNAMDLEKTMFVYQQWLGGLPPARQFELRDQSPAERVATVKQWAAEMRDDALLTLSEDELKSLFQQIRGPLNAIRPAPPLGDQRGPGRAGRERGSLFSQLANFRKLLNEHLFSGDGAQQQFYRAVVDALPPRTRQPFEQLPRRQQVDRFLTWMRQYAALVGEISQEDLERFFADELDVNTRTELLKLPPGQMEQALRWQYRQQPNSGFQGAAWWGPGPDRGGWGRQRQGGPRRGPGPDGDRPRPPRFGPPDQGFGRPGDMGPPPQRDFGGPNGPPPYGPPEDRRDFGPGDRPGPPPPGPNAPPP